MPIESFMDRAASLIFPGSRTLANWWRQLSSHQPLALGIGYGFLHRIEAPVCVLSQEPVDPLVHLVLQALALEKTPCVGVAGLQHRLSLPLAIVHRILAGMQEAGLVALSEAGGWRATERGNHALERRIVGLSVQKR